MENTEIICSFNEDSLIHPFTKASLSLLMQRQLFEWFLQIKEAYEKRCKYHFEDGLTHITVSRFFQTIGIS